MRGSSETLARETISNDQNSKLKNKKENWILDLGIVWDLELEI